MGIKTMISRNSGNLVALTVAIVISAGGIFWQQERLRAVPAEAFFEVKSVSVPNFIEGDNPLIVYDRLVKKQFMGFWNVEVHMLAGATDYAYCTGSGSAKYETKEQLPKIGVTLEWFIGKDCHLPPGQWILQTNWEIHADGYPPKFLTFNSNSFNILPVGSQLFLTPEQSKKLEKVAP